MRLTGKYGYIEFNNNSGKAVIKQPILQQRYGNEVNITADQLAKWIGILKINSTEDGRIQLGKW
jgi:hypothetical protein